MRIGGGAVSIADVTDRTARDLGFVRPFWLNEIRAGRAFTRGTVTGPSVGNNSHIQLINPAGSGITVILFQAALTVDTAGIVYGHTHNVNLPTDIGAGVNLLAGGAAAVAHLRTAANAGLLGTQVNTYRFAAGVHHNLIGDWLWELGVGEGILFVPNDVNVEIAGTFRWIEV